MSPNASNMAKLSPGLSVRRLEAARETTPGTRTGFASSSRFMRRASRGRYRAPPAERAVHGQVVLRHACRREAFFEALAHGAAIKARSAAERGNRGVDRVDDEARAPVLDDLGHRAVRPGDHRGAAGQRLDHGETEGLRPLDR